MTGNERVGGDATKVSKQEGSRDLLVQSRHPDPEDLEDPEDPEAHTCGGTFSTYLHTDRL